MHRDTKVILNISRRLLLETTHTEKQIAKILFISETSFRVLYKKHLGYPPKKYIRLVKMKKAHTLIRISNKTISEIANEIGYINISKFTEAFRSIYLVTPSNYRKTCGFGVEKDTCNSLK